MNLTDGRARRGALSGLLIIVLLVLVAGTALQAQDKALARKLKGFDAYMEKVLKDWNAPGVGVGIVAGDKLVFAKGYGYPGLREEAPVHGRRRCSRSPPTPSSSPRWPRACWWRRAS